MHDLKYCVRHNGKVYCWDDANERIVTVVINDMEINECPEYVMKLIMRKISSESKDNS